MARQKKGCQTPTQSIILHYKKTASKGPDAVEWYNQTGRTAQKWQADLITHILAVNKNGLWVHTKFGYSVPRRNGKNEILIIREIWGLLNGEKILHTAHRTTASHSAWERLCSALDNAGIDYKSVQAKGCEEIRIKAPGGGRIDFRTRSSKGGLGEGFDLLIIDEAQEYTDDQESALKYVVSDSHNPQIIFCGTPPTPISSGTVFVKLRNSALQGQAKNTGWAEWSVDEQTDPHDRAAWYQTNPSLGSVLSERKIEDEIGPDAVDFNIQRLGLWLRYNQKSAISKTEWAALQKSPSPQLKSKLFVGIKYGHAGDSVAVCIAAKTVDNLIFVEALDCRDMRAGNGWIVEFLAKADVDAVIIDGANGQQLLADAMKDKKLKAPILPTVRQVIVANAAFEQGIFSKRLCHAGQPALAQVAANCEKRAIGSNGGFGYRSILEGAKIELLESAALAYWAASEAKEKRPQKISY